jgi:hypothetical protein
MVIINKISIENSVIMYKFKKKIKKLVDKL